MRRRFLPERERSIHLTGPYLERACGGDLALVAAVQAQLSPDAAQATATIAGMPHERAAGSSIGPYKLVRQIAEGGMGVVYQAQQLQPLRRDVGSRSSNPG